jgi:hypothetical protein
LTHTEPSPNDFANPIFWKHYLNESQLRRAKYFLDNNTEPTLKDFANPIFCKHWEREKRLRDKKEKRDQVRGGGILDPFICGRIVEKRGSSSTKCASILHIHPDPSKQAEGKKYYNNYNSEKSEFWSLATKEEYLKQKRG